MIDIMAKEHRAIPLGRLGENEHVRVWFDVSQYQAQYPEATFTLLNKRPGDEVAYPVVRISTDEKYIVWTITSAELTTMGLGECELIVMEGNVVAKSVIYSTQVLEAIDGSGEAPEPWDSWQKEFAEMVEEAQDAAAEAAESVEHYPRIGDGVWMVWDASTGAYVSTGVQATGPKGDPGDPGVSPTVTVTAITGGHRVTITDADGTRAFDVMDGTDGDDGRGIASAALNADYTLTMTYTDGTTYTTPSLRGAKGDDGISPTVTVTQTATGATLTVTDAEGTTTAEIANGKDGDPGAPGAPGTPGTPGMDGVSPTVSITDITGGHRVTITDATGPHSFDVMDGDSAEVPVQDVQVNGVSVLTDGVANVPVATSDRLGVVRPFPTRGTTMYSGYITTYPASDDHIKAGGDGYKPLTPATEHSAAFYGFAKAAGDTTQSTSSNAVGTYTETAKSKISEMLSAPVSVSGTTPSITALSGIQYVCAEVSTLDIIPPASGCFDVIFESGSTPTALNISNPTGTTVEWLDDFDPTNISANTVYEINLLRMGTRYLGVAGSWT